MAYPKPLLDKTIEKRYESLNLPKETLSTLHRFFHACSNLYGVIDLDSMWNLYRELNQTQGLPPVRRRNLIEFSSVARRDGSVPYFVFEVEEIYLDEPHRDSSRLVVNKDVVSPGSWRYHGIYSIEQEAYGKPLFVPKDFLSWVNPPVPSEEKALLRFLENLTVTANEVEKWGVKIKCEHKGEKLKDFVFESAGYKMAYKWSNAEYEGGRKTVDHKHLEWLKKGLCSNAAEYLVYNAKKNFDYMLKGSQGFQQFFDDLYEMGVELTDLQSKILLELLQDFINNLHMYSNGGWTPKELGRIQGPRKGPIAMDFGPGILKAMERGDIDRNEIERMLKDYGMDPLN